MPKRTSPRDADDLLDAKDLEHLVRDKREGWRATGAKARRRQRRYKKLLISNIPLSGDEEDETWKTTKGPSRHAVFKLRYSNRS